MMFFARCVDYFFFYFLLSLGAPFLPIYVDTLSYFLGALLTPIIHAPIEALCVSLWGRTLGSKILGLAPRKVSFKEALKSALFLKKSPKGALSLKRKILAVLCASICLGGSFSTESLFFQYASLQKTLSTENWIRYAVQAAGFSVDLPFSPIYLSQEFKAKGKTLVYHEYNSSVGEDLSYSVGYMELPRKWRLARSQTLLNGALDLILKQEGGELVYKESVRHQKLAALNFSYKKGEKIVEGRLVLARHALFRLAVIYPEAISNDLNKSSFLESFETRS